jgi:hypothetical protein
MERSIGSSNLLLSLTLACVDSSDDGGDSSKSIFGLLDLGDGDVGGVDGQLIGCSIGFVFGELVDMDDPFLSVDLDDLSLGAFAGTSEDDDLIVFADG